MRLRHERPVTKSNARPGLAANVPIAASLLFTASIIGCAKNSEPVSSPASIPSQQTAASDAQLTKPMANPFSGLQGDGPFFEPICQAPEKENNASLSSSTPKSYSESLASLRSSGFDGAADALEGRANQKSQKMKIDEERAVKISDYLLNKLPNMPNASELEKLMPRSVVELVVAVEERGVSQVEAEKIADFLLRFTGAMRFQNLKQFDSNHSHVIGRDWDQIDYSGEGTTWQQRKRQWTKFGVVSFKEAQYIRNYFEREKELGYFTNIYRPEGQWP
ncbi:MAG: hypothetical protein PHF60_01135 [Candidatus ainarchaeum sp.]|nr:hypothetical protein [Candidatus ainarchaeum sp.]